LEQVYHVVGPLDGNTSLLITVADKYNHVASQIHIFCPYMFDS
jgi:hypothetical protein